MPAGDAAAGVTPQGDTDRDSAGGAGMVDGPNFEAAGRRFDSCQARQSRPVAFGTAGLLPPARRQRVVRDLRSLPPAAPALCVEGRWRGYHLHGAVAALP